MYNPNKPEKYHINTVGVCDSVTGYAFNLLIYFGKETSFHEGQEGGQSEKVFEYLLRSLGSSYHVFADKYYTTYSLIYVPFLKEYLLHRNAAIESQEFLRGIENLKDCSFGIKVLQEPLEWNDKKEKNLS